MPAPAAPSPSWPAKFAAQAWWIFLLAALVLLGVATGRRIARVEAVTNTPTWSVDAPRRDDASPTGWENGQRRLIVPGHHNPSYWWIMEAQLAAEQGLLRVRHVDYDAQPDGREIRRTAPYRWWLVAVGRLDQAVRGGPPGLAIERGALIADPLLLALLLVAGAVYCARYLGRVAACGFVVAGISLFPLAAGFQPGAPDPHSLAWVLALGSILPLFGAARPVGTQARAHYIAAGIFGGLGLWNDATSQGPVLLATVLGAFCGELIRSSGAGRPAGVSAPWRAWAAAGALTVLGATLFEYAPDHFSWSLDFVHPVHAVAWWGFGETLRAAAIWARQGRQGFARRSLVLLGAAGLAMTLWPVVAMRTDSGALLGTDMYAQQLANVPGAGHARGFGEWLRQPGGDGAKAATLLPCILGLVVLVRILPGRVDREERGRLVFALVAAALAAVLACVQLRWWNLFDVLALVVMPVLLTGVDGGNLRVHLKAAGVMLPVLPGLFVGWPPAVAERPEISPLEAQALIERDFAYWLVKRAGPEPNVLFSTPFFSGAAAYYGGFGVVVSTDAENGIGFQTCVRIASASSAQEASVLLQSRKVTHLVLPKWDPLLDRLVRIGRGLSPDQPLPHQALVVALREWDVPFWLRPMDYLIPNEPQFQGFELEAFALQAEQEPDIGLSRLADHFLDRGLLQLARAMKEPLKNYPRSVAALGTIASIDLAAGEGARVRESLETLIPALSRRWARDLPADRRISLAALFVRTRREDLARQQLTACLDGLDLATLRTLSPGSVVNLVALGRTLGVPFRDQELETAALELMPPRVRAALPPK